MNSVGLLFNDFLEDIGAGVGGLALAIGVNNSFMSFSGKQNIKVININ